MIFDNTIVSDMRVGHKQAVTANSCNPTAILGTKMNRDKLADFIAVTDFEARLFTMKFQILRNRSNRSKLKDLVITADFRTTFNNGVGPNSRS